MTDNIVCKYPLPLAGANDRHYETKAFECDGTDYEIREDGTLWCDCYKTGIISKPPASPYLGVTHIGWVQRSDFSGEVTFYAWIPPHDLGWLEWCAVFEAGKVVEVKLIKNSEGTP